MKYKHHIFATLIIFTLMIASGIGIVGFLPAIILGPLIGSITEKFNSFKDYLKFIIVILFSELDAIAITYSALFYYSQVTSKYLSYSLNLPLFMSQSAILFIFLALYKYFSKQSFFKVAFIVVTLISLLLYLFIVKSQLSNV